MLTDELREQLAILEFAVNESPLSERVTIRTELAQALLTERAALLAELERLRALRTDDLAASCGRLADTQEAERAALLAVVNAAAAFIVDSEHAGGPPSGACNACYWNLRGAVRAYQAAGAAGEG